MNLIGVRIFVVPMVLAALACKDPSGPAPVAITALPRSLTTAEQKLIVGSNAFAFYLLKQINSQQLDSNVFVSPLSASMALGMTANGAAGATYDSMHSALRLGDATRQEVNEGYKSLIALLRRLDNTTDFRIANSIWFEKTFTFNTSFLDESRNFFGAQVQGLDFKSPDAVRTINAWASDNTAKKIPSIIDSIDPNEVMFLINAIYFKGQWQKQFDKSKTTDAKFFALDGSSPMVPMMHQSETLRIAQTPTLTAVDLPYGNSAFAMTVLLPNPGGNVNSLAGSLTDDAWNAVLGRFQPGQADLYLPRFKLTWGRDMSDDLRALGMGNAFLNADFTPMSPAGKKLVITKVVQKTFVDVNEEGTEAAAVTSVGIGVTSAPVSTLIRIDRPFVFVIRERFSGTILFMGKIAKLPAAS